MTQTSSQASSYGSQEPSEKEIWDKYGSTFRHEFHFEYRKGDPVIGYSNKTAYTEGQRINVLKGVISRLWFGVGKDPGYAWKGRDGIIRMDFYMQTTFSRKMQPLILTLYPSTYQAFGSLLEQKEFCKWLTGMYRPSTTVAGKAASNPGLLWDAKQTEKIEAELRLKEIGIHQKFNPILAQNPIAEVDVFEDHHALHEYCAYLAANRIRPRPVVETYYRAMVARFPKYLPENSL